MKIAALLLCAGSGTRFASPIPKQFHRLGEKKIYRYPLDILINSELFFEIRIVTQAEYTPYLDKHPSCKVVHGGKTRQESVALGLQGLDTDFIIICEGARPFLSKHLLEEHIKKLRHGASAVNTCIPCTDTINIHKSGVIKEIPNRDQFFQGQTPQSFSYAPLVKAHQETTKIYTDDCSLLLEEGFQISYVLGSEKNLKITTLHDLEIAKMITSFSCKTPDISV